MLISWLAATVLMMMLHFPAWAYMEAGSFEATKWVAPLSLASCSLAAVVETAMTV